MSNFILVVAFANQDGPYIIVTYPVFTFVTFVGGRSAQHGTITALAILIVVIPLLVIVVTITIVIVALLKVVNIIIVVVVVIVQVKEGTTPYPAG